MSPFATVALRNADRVLSHMNEPYLGYTTSIGLIVHELHMQEMWHHVKIAYAMLKGNLPKQIPEFCRCAKDVRNNGIMERMNQFATFVFRNPRYDEEREEIEKNRGLSFIGWPSKELTLQAWGEFKNGQLSYLDDQTVRDMGLFMYCMLDT